MAAIESDIEWFDNATFARTWIWRSMKTRENYVFTGMSAAIMLRDPGISVATDPDANVVATFSTVNGAITIDDDGFHLTIPPEMWPAPGKYKYDVRIHTTPSHFVPQYGKWKVRQGVTTA